MAKEDVSKIKDIANHFCNMSLDEILKLPNPEGFEFVDRFFDRAFLIKTEEDFGSLQNQISYFSSIRNEEVVKE